jgi:hypothetical protein
LSQLKPDWQLQQWTPGLLDLSLTGPGQLQLVLGNQAKGAAPVLDLHL